LALETWLVSDPKVEIVTVAKFDAEVKRWRSNVPDPRLIVPERYFRALL
jgi:hypothetical protein